MKVRFLSNFDIALNLLNIIRKHPVDNYPNFNISSYKKAGASCDIFVSKNSEKV